MQHEAPVRFLTLATDYDGTLARDGAVSEATLAALERFLSSGRRLILVTGRELDDLESVFPRLDLFHRVVAENGALLYRPASGESQALAEPPSEEFVDLLRRLGVGPISVGRVIVATWRPHESAVLEAIRRLGLELQVVFNKDAVMVLPSGVNKRTGLKAALKELELSFHNTVGVGDAENDHAFLGACACSVAVDNALPAVMKTADLVTAASHGEGVTELIGLMLEDDLVRFEDRLKRHWVPIGRSPDGETVAARPFRENVLVAGTSGSGKSSLTTLYLERLRAAGFQFCLIDPEGDYGAMEEMIEIGDAHRAPSEEEVVRILRNPAQSAGINLVGLPPDDRPSYFAGLMPHLRQLRARLGHPHAIIVDEAHHLLPGGRDPALSSYPWGERGLFLITVHPEHVVREILSGIDLVFALGEDPETTLRPVADHCGVAAPSWPQRPLPAGHAVAWRVRGPGPPLLIKVDPARAERRRHLRKYAEGELPPERSFFFTGPRGKLHLRAHNLMLFLQMGEGVDEETWLHHLRCGDYSAWLRNQIKDVELAAAVAAIERTPGIGAQESRGLIRRAIEERYTAPA